MGPVFWSPTPTPGRRAQRWRGSALASPWLWEGNGGGWMGVRQELQQSQLETRVPAPWPILQKPALPRGMAVPGNQSHAP